MKGIIQERYTEKYSPNIAINNDATIEQKNPI
jgi:hypothetical protein